MEFPGILGVALWRLKLIIQEWPLAALGPFFGIIAADLAIDLGRGNYGSFGVDVVIAPLTALVILQVAAREHAGIAGVLMFVLGVISSVGAVVLLTLGLVHGSGPLFAIGLRHLTVTAYVWASIAIEPPQRHRPAFAFHS